MLSPGFTGALKSFSVDDGAEPDAVLHIANRLMDYHESFLAQAERCLHTTVNRDVTVFVQDMGALTMCPLAGFEQFIETMCRRVAEGRELLPHAEGTVLLDDVQLAISLPDGLAQRITAHIKEFSAWAQSRYLPVRRPRCGVDDLASWRLTWLPSLTRPIVGK